MRDYKRERQRTLSVPLQSCAPNARKIPAGNDYDRNVRYYTTKSMNGGTTFKCSLCEHTVTTLSFNSVIGNRRTQAATAMNQHAAALHLPSQLPTPTKMGGRGAL